MAKITFQTEDIIFNLKNKTQVKSWLKKIIEKENSKYRDLTYIFCSDHFLLKINQEYLKHDNYTDVITFDYSEILNSKIRCISGDIFISIDRIIENSNKFNTSFESELKRVISHGTLHLLGYKDKNKVDKDLMTKKENESLELYEHKTK